MSRHKKAYDEDELYDYDDYDYDDYDDNVEYNNNKSENNYDDEYYDNEVTYEKPDINIEEAVQTIRETLSINSNIISNDRIKQILDLYDNNIDKTVDYFLKQKSTASKQINKSITATSNAVNESNNAKLTKDSISKSKTKEVQKVSTNKSTSSQLSNDLELLGLNNNKTQLEIASDDDIASFDEKEGNTLSYFTLVVVGHVDAGKSTLVGNVLLQLDNNNNTKSSHKSNTIQNLSWMTDESQTEREHGVTIDVAEKQFHTLTNHFTILDTPGHKDYIPNMISGASLADVAILVVPGNDNEYEVAISSKGQTYEHATLLKSLGVNQVIVAVNKLDNSNPPWSEERFNSVSSSIRSLLTTLNFRNKAIRIVPVSGLTGENIVTVSSTCLLNSWYTGPTLIQALDTFNPPKRQYNKPLRGIITNIIDNNLYTNSNNRLKYFNISIKIFQGRLCKNRTINISQHSFLFKVIQIITLDGQDIDILKAGQQGEIKIMLVNERYYDEVRLIDRLLLYKNKPLLKSYHKFKATIVTMNAITPIIPGSSFQLFLLGNEVECKITKFYRLLNPEKRITEKYPKVIGSNKTASVCIITDRDIIIERFSECNILGRFALRLKGKIYAVGVCTQLPSDY